MFTCPFEGWMERENGKYLTNSYDNNLKLSGLSNNLRNKTPQ